MLITTDRIESNIPNISYLKSDKFEKYETHVSQYVYWKLVLDLNLIEQ